MTCKMRGKKAVYIGETSKTMRERAREHHKDARVEREYSHIHSHKEEEHREEEMDMRFDLVKK